MLERRNPMQGEIWRRSNGDRYQILAVAMDTETGGKKVIYKALFGDRQVFCTPMNKFLAESNRLRNPNDIQKYQFEKSA